MLDWPHTEHMQMHRGKEAGMVLACLKVNNCCCMEVVGSQEATCGRNTSCNQGLVCKIGVNGNRAGVKSNGKGA